MLQYLDGEEKKLTLSGAYDTPCIRLHGDDAAMNVAKSKFSKGEEFRNKNYLFHA